ncbi:DUF2290 domain-containing protein [Agrobacterium fabrum]|uniref:DUF2290 domain-containing protein n=1 Tax=Agrobacterium fabrum TaxID=1176649 RepID=UPI0015743676|nr:DUF2290 domain-containing protein [Agrobacterium fabrum]WIE30877.1 DUF2290 domain-containing protein [Agrobacterium fabrum]WIE46824.1 DUF2290 domain-containing protein [Agrobacterium fabrum]
MKRDDFNASIRAIHGFYSSEDLVEGTVYPVALPRSEAFNKISLTTTVYENVFEAGLSLSHYNFILRDLAFFQFSHSSEQEWALAYYPNPRISGCPDALQVFTDLKAELEHGELSEEEFSSLASSLHVGNYIPRIRFEYSQIQYRPVRHPGAHFHIGMSGEDRWSSSRKLSPLTFGLLIAKHYYPELWWPKSRFSLTQKDQNLAANIEHCVDEKLMKSIQADGTSHIVSDFERLTFHFTAMQPSVPTK